MKKLISVIFLMTILAVFVIATGCEVLNSEETESLTINVASVTENGKELSSNIKVEPDFEKDELKVTYYCKNCVEVNEEDIEILSPDITSEAIVGNEYFEKFSEMESLVKSHKSQAKEAGVKPVEEFDIFLVTTAGNEMRTSFDPDTDGEDFDKVKSYYNELSALFTENVF